jgi:dienelactone hydrolase
MVGECCLKGFKWDGQPAGVEYKVGGLDCYVSSPGSKVAIVVLHDIFGWKFLNNRLLADHLANEVGATVYVPDL